MRRNFIFAALPDGIRDQLPVRRNAEHIYRGGVIAAFTGVHQHLVCAVQAWPGVQHGLVLLRKPHREEVAPAAFPGQRKRRHLEQACKLLLQRFAPRQRLDQRIGMMVLRINPRTRLRRFLVFEPPVRVRDLDARGDFVNHGVDARRRRACCRLILRQLPRDVRRAHHRSGRHDHQ